MPSPFLVAPHTHDLMTHTHPGALDKKALRSHLHDQHVYTSLNIHRLLYLLYMFGCCVYFAICIALLIANTQPDDVIDAEFFIPYHYLEFWGQCGFTMLEALVLIHSEMVPLFSLPALLFLVNVVASLVAAILFTINGHIFDRTAHWIEYVVQITITGANLVFILTNKGGKNSLSSALYKYRYWECAFVGLMMVHAIIQVLVFAGVIRFPDIPVYDQAAHYFEYTGEMANTTIVFVFALAVYITLNRRRLAFIDSLQDSSDVESNGTTENDFQGQAVHF